ncbi:MAG: hypothetical protein AB8G96_13350 [Phycisphaerales bacterium]
MHRTNRTASAHPQGAGISAAIGIIAATAAFSVVPAAAAAPSAVDARVAPDAILAPAAADALAAPPASSTAEPSGIFDERMELALAGRLTLQAPAGPIVRSASQPRAGGVGPDSPSAGQRDEIVAGVWFARLGGEVELGAGNGTFFIDRDIRNDDLEPSPLIEWSRLDDEGFARWRFHGFAFSSEGEGDAARGFTFGSLNFAAGDRYATETDMYSLGADWMPYRWTAVGGSTNRGSGDVRLDFSAILGSRWVYVDQSITRVGTGAGFGTEAPDAHWLALMGGVRMELNWAPPEGLMIGRSFRMTAEYGLGAAVNSGGGTFWQVRAGAELEFAPGTRGFFGYRLVELGFREGDWDYDAGLQGLFAGLTIAF